jgi:dienelactone hydrolase
MQRTITLLSLLILTTTIHAQPKQLPNTDPLTWSDDIASRMVAGIDQFLLKELDRSTARRQRFWRRTFGSPENYPTSIENNRARLAHILGVRDQRVKYASPELVATVKNPALLADRETYLAYAIRWPSVRDVWGEGILLVPKDRKPIASFVAIPDADQTPEQICGLADGVHPRSQFARRLAENGCRVIVPVLIDRKVEARNGRAKLSSREFLYRPSFELGRHIIGYEVQKVMAAVDWFAKDENNIAVMGWGEGGMIALFAGALDERIKSTCTSGYFRDARFLWQEPIDRNVFGLLEQFGDAELASMVVTRALTVEVARGPQVTVAGNGAAPGELRTPHVDVVRNEVERAKTLVGKFAGAIEIVTRADGSGDYGSDEALQATLSAMIRDFKLAPAPDMPQQKELLTKTNPDHAARQLRQVKQIEQDTQRLLSESAAVRVQFMKNLSTKSPEEFAKTSEDYRKLFYSTVIGKFEQPLLDLKVKSRLTYETPKYLGYEVVIDVWEDVFAYGILLLPKDLKEGEKRPVIVCQHGLEGRPQDLVLGKKDAYRDFAAKLTERGFITFSPQNPYIFTDRFRTLQRKANPLGKSLFSIITPQHQQIINWLKTLPNVDGNRIGFYGLSYGGKTAMRVPAIITDYSLSICSADFNEWVWKNASTSPTNPYSYVWTGEYEIFEFDLGSTFNYAEMATLIAPRPFMVERGHFDGVAPDEMVAHEFAKVRHLYQARLGLKDRCEIEWFPGPHTINGKGTFDFLHKHLNWPAPQH